MSGPEAAEILRRFFIVTLLLIPLTITSELGIRFLEMPDFSGRSYVEFMAATVRLSIWFSIFQHARHESMAKNTG